MAFTKTGRKTNKIISHNGQHLASTVRVWSNALSFFFDLPSLHTPLYIRRARTMVKEITSWVWKNELSSMTVEPGIILSMYSCLCVSTMTSYFAHAGRGVFIRGRRLFHLAPLIILCGIDSRVVSIRKNTVDAVGL